MKLNHLILASSVALCLNAAPPAFAQGTAFTFQGRLSEGTNPANGIFDLKLALCDSSNGPTVLGAVTNSAVPVTNGLFTVTLDFGPAAFDGSLRWLDIGVRTNGSGTDYVSLVPRQPVTPTPYAIHAANAKLLDGQARSFFAPADGSPNYVAKIGDTMTGSLNLPANGLLAGGNQLVLSGGNVGIGTASPENKLHIFSGYIQMDRGYGVGSDFRNVGGWYRPNLGVALPHSSEYGSLNFLAHASGFAPHIAFRNAADNSAWMVLSDGNVGIGTTTPAAKLEIRNASASEISALRLTESHPATSGDVIKLEFFGDSPDSGVEVLRELARIQAHNIQTDSHHGYLSFWTMNATEIGERMRIDQSGRVGIGTSAPRWRLHVSQPTAPELTTLALEASGQSVEGAINRLTFRTGTLQDGATRDIAALAAINSNLGSHHGTLAFSTMEAGVLTEKMRITPSGNVGIGASPRWRLHVSQPTGPEVTTLALEASGQSAEGAANRLTFRTGTLQDGATRDIAAIAAINSNQGAHHGSLGFSTMEAAVLTEKVRITPSGNVGIGTTSPQAKLHVSGEILTKAVNITAGADIAEPFPVAGPDIPKGAVVVIDDTQPGQLKLSERAYDTRVAGIVSGANGVNSGLTLRQEGALEGNHNVALTGRVYALADASDAAIQPGDLLTTAESPGYCMKVTDRDKANGAILGKAMSGLKEGKGLILVLVALQ